MTSSANPERTTLAQKIAWVLFCLTCVELTLLNSYAKVITGVKADVYAGLLCAFTLAVCVLAAGKGPVRATLPEVVISVALIALGIAAGLASATPWSSTVYVFVFAGTSIGGFWCARILLNSPSRQRTFVWLCSMTLALVAALGLFGHYFHGQVTHFSLDTHLLTDTIFLLSFGPLALLAWRKRLATVLGVVILAAAYVVLYIIGVSAADTAVLAPMVVLVFALLIVPARSGAKLVGFLLLLVLVAVTVHYLSNYSTKQHLAKGYNAVRLEYYPFSWHIAKKSPFLGLGLRTPREDFLNDYEIWNPYYSKSEFQRHVTRLKVCQNIFLTLMVGLGLPFAILYAAVVIVLFFRLVRAAARGAPGAVVPPVSLLIPLACSLFHLMVMDLLLMPYIAWFFHILLGMIPKPQPKAVTAESSAPVRSASILRFAPVAIAVIIIGIFLGTHPAFDPKKLPSRDELIAYVKNLPLLAPFFAEPTGAATSVAAFPGVLVVNLQGYERLPSNWAVMCILDNSESMGRTGDPWRTSRLGCATEFLNALSDSMRSGSRIGVRAFLEQSPLRRGHAEVGLRVSRVLCGWTDTPAKRLEFAVDGNLSQRENNLCAAAEISAQRDFQPESSPSLPRALLMTDGRTNCSIGGIAELFAGVRIGGNMPVLDVAAFGMKEETTDVYAQAVREANGVFLKIDAPEDVPRVVSEYVAWLSKSVPATVVVSGQGEEHTMAQGTQITLPPGAYTVALPEAPGLDASDRKIPNVMVRPGETTTLRISVAEGKPIVEQ